MLKRLRTALAAVAANLTAATTALAGSGVSNTMGDVGKEGASVVGTVLYFAMMTVWAYVTYLAISYSLRMGERMAQKANAPDREGLYKVAAAFGAVVILVFVYYWIGVFLDSHGLGRLAPLSQVKDALSLVSFGG